MHYVSHISHQLEKYKFNVTCPGAFLWDPHQAHPSMKNNTSMFSDPNGPERTL
jgi:hypothetical protein